MAQARVCILLLALTAAIAAVSGADDLQAQGQKTAAGFQQQLLAALAKLRSDYDAAEAAEIKAASAEVKAALQKGSAALAKMRVPQRAALQALAKQVGKEAGELFGKYTALISKYQKDKVAAADQKATKAAIQSLRQSKQALLVKWENALVALLFDMRAALRAGYKGTAASPAVQKSVNASVVKLVDTLIGLQSNVINILISNDFAAVGSFATSANAALFRLNNHAEAAAAA